MDAQRLSMGCIRQVSKIVVSRIRGSRRAPLRDPDDLRR